MLAKRHHKKVAVVLLVFFANYIVLPTKLYALTGGPGQPEFSSFEPVTGSNMVDEFSGDFVYNLPLMEVPGPHGSGYGINLSYHSGVMPEEEASWVGYGFTLNPGAINRNARGIPDDYNGNEIKYYNQVPDNWTVTVGGGGGAEAFSADIPVSANASIRYNNYKGFGYNAGAGIVLGKGVASLGYNLSDNRGSFSLNINPAKLLSRLNKKDAEGNAAKNRRNDVKKWSIAASNIWQGIKNQNVNILGSNYGVRSFNEVNRPLQVSQYSGNSFDVSMGVEGNVSFLPAGVTANVMGSFTIMCNEDEDNINSYGYLYADQASADDVKDYYIEKETYYNKRDVFLGIPFNTADNYIVTGQGIGGSFRLHHKDVGQLYPNEIKSTTAIENISAEVDVGTNIGVGLDVGGGVQTLEHTAWDASLSEFSSLTGGDDEPVFFRFINDMGGYWDHPTGGTKVRANVGGGGVLGFKSYSPDLGSISTRMNNGNRSGRSSYIGFNINADMLGDLSKSYRINTKRQDIEAMVMRDGKCKSGIGEFFIYTENGYKYAYGLPVYNRNEANMQYGVNNAYEDVDHGYLVYSDLDAIKVGEVKEDPYASAYLMTEITSPDYIDRTHDGPTPDDFGGYTRFNYTKEYGYKKETGFYKWRNPYTGRLYNRNSLSDPKDDMGSVSSGEKEIYYLHSIETKSHVALFTTSKRIYDGRDAAGANASTDRNAMGPNALKRLDQVDLYAIEDLEKDANGYWTPVAGASPIKTVKLRYNNNLCPGLKNSPTNSGKLTLEKVWFEYNNNTTKISPYEFLYTYASGETSYPSKYSEIKDGYDDYTSEAQNPPYSYFNSDAWGFYQYDGQNRYEDMQSWVNQDPDPDDFDPAAWQLKRIKLPSGGEIHVQYEQDDYAYVQNKVAHAMVSLTGIDPFSKDYTLDLSDLGLEAGDVDEKLEIVRLLRKYYIDDPERKIYFKFLFTLIGTTQPDISKCNAEYITGYAKVTDVTADAGNTITIELRNTLLDSYDLPCDVCRDFIKTERFGNILLSGNCSTSPAGIELLEGPEKMVEQLLSFATNITMPLATCNFANPDLSYFRIPVPTRKLGGGLRVKRLLLYDKGLENNPVLYGKEYTYKYLDEESGLEKSSGVATNEPPSIREENVLVTNIDRESQGFISKVISGVDMKQVEGPLGESIMPGASVGYSNVIITNIHSGETNPGFDVKEFHTVKEDEYAFKWEKTEIVEKMDYFPMYAFLVNVLTNNLWASQGFTFTQSNMHGQPKSEKHYSGDYNEILNLADAKLVSATEYTYFRPGEKLPVSSEFGGPVEYLPLGKEVDITFGQKAVKDNMNVGNSEQDFTVGFAFIPLPFITWFPSYTHTEMEMYTHAVTKVVSYPAVLKKIETSFEGITNTQEYMLFDKYSGKPIAVKSNDEYQGSYLSYSIPASWEYKNMQPMWINMGYKQTGFEFSKNGVKSYLTVTDPNSCNILSNYVEGDLLDIGSGYLYHVIAIDYLNNRLEIKRSNESKAGDPPDVDIVEVIRSGRTNQVSAMAGGLTFHSTTSINELPKLDEGDVRYYYPSISGAQEQVDQLIIALNTELDKIKNGLQPNIYFELAGPFTNVDMSVYLSEIPDDVEIADIQHAKVQNLKYFWQMKDDKVTLKLIRFEIEKAGGGYETVEGIMPGEVIE